MAKLSTSEDLEAALADASLAIGAIKLDPAKPFLWASGYHMPIYNDNRKHLGHPKNRELIRQGLARLIDESGIRFDFVAGTSTAGIAPATLVANHYETPLVILQEGVAYQFPVHPELNAPHSRSEAIASTAPFGIPYGVATAERDGHPFLYVRREAKDHGTRQRIEGDPRIGQRVTLCDHHKGKSYFDDAAAALAERGLRMVMGTSQEAKAVTPVELRGRSGIVIEDLISTGGSSAKEVAAYRALGASVPACFSIFSYGLDEAARVFREQAPGCLVRSALGYDALVRRAEETGGIDALATALLREWRADPFGWGARHGFPPVKK